MPPRKSTFLDRLKLAFAPEIETNRLAQARARAGLQPFSKTLGVGTVEEEESERLAIEQENAKQNALFQASQGARAADLEQGIGVGRESLTPPVPGIFESGREAAVEKFGLPSQSFLDVPTERALGVTSTLKNLRPDRPSAPNDFSPVIATAEDERVTGGLVKEGQQTTLGTIKRGASFRTATEASRLRGAGIESRRYFSS